MPCLALHQTSDWIEIRYLSPARRCVPPGRVVFPRLVLLVPCSGRLVLRSFSYNLHLRVIHNFPTCNCPGGIQLHKNEGSSSPLPLPSLMPLHAAACHLISLLYHAVLCLQLLVPHKALFPSSQLPEPNPLPRRIQLVFAHYLCRLRWLSKKYSSQKLTVMRFVQALRRSIKGDKDKGSVAPKSAVAIVPPKKVGGLPLPSQSQASNPIRLWSATLGTAMVPRQT